MAVGYGNAGTALAAASGTTAAIPVPSSVAAGDIIVAVFFISGANVPTPPSGFTAASGIPLADPGGYKLYVYWKRATGADSGTYDFTWTGGNTYQGQAYRFTGCATTGDPFDGTASTSTLPHGGGSTTFSAPSLTTTVNDTMLLWAVMHEFSTYRLTTPSGFTEVLDADFLAVDYKAHATAGATGSITATSAGNDQGCTWMGALKPAIPASPSFFYMF
jgi:hypothetical protein